MKLCRSELLLMGGMYQILAFIITLFSSEISFAMNGILYVLFWAAVLALSFSFVSSWGFVYKMNDNFPRLSVFLASIGWIPYFSVLYALITWGVDYMTSSSDGVTVFLSNYMPVYDIFVAAIVLSLMYATYKVFIKSEELEMSCLTTM